MREKLLDECRLLDEHATYNAEIHHTIAVSERWWAQASTFIPAAITAVSSVVAVNNATVPIWGWITVAGAIATAASSVFSFEKSYEAHIDSGKGFTVLKHELRALLLAFHEQYSDEELVGVVRKMLDQYIELVRTAPPTTNRAFKKAHKHIEGEGRHKSVESAKEQQ